MKYLLVVFVVLNFGIDSLVIKRRDEVQPTNSNDQGITNSTGKAKQQPLPQVDLLQKFIFYDIP